MFRPRFTSEKRCREETIARAVGIVERARGAGRDLTIKEQLAVDALLTTAELCLDLRQRIPREPDELLAYARQPMGARLGPFLTKGIEGIQARRIP